MEKKSRRRFAILASVISVRASIGLIWASAGPLLPLMMQAFGISRGSVSWYASAAPLTIAIVSLPLGVIASKYSLKKTFAIGAAFQGAGVLASVMSTFMPILLTRVLFAIGTSVTVPVATAIATEWFTARRLPIINGVTISLVNLGNAVGFAATVPIATFISWQAPIVVYGAFALTCAIAWMVVGKDRAPVGAAASQTDRSQVEDMRPSLGLKRLLTRRSTLLLAFTTMGWWCLNNTTGSWLPDYYHQVFNMPLEQASSILSIMPVVGTVASITGGILSLRIGRRKPFLIFSGALMGVSALSAILFNNLIVIYAGIVMLGISANSHTPSTFTIPMELPDTSVRSGVAILSIMQSFGNLGNFIGPLLVGYLSDITGSYLPGFFTAAALSLTVLLAGLLLPETGPGRKAVGVNGPVEVAASK